MSPDIVDPLIVRPPFKERMGPGNVPADKLEEPHVKSWIASGLLLAWVSTAAHAQQTQGPPTREPFVAELSGRLEQLAAADKFSGAVLIARNNETIFASAYGFADRERKIPNSVDTKFRIGSMNKMFTAVAVLSLVQAGKIKLDAPVGKYLRNYPNREIATRVTVHQLLTHTGGTGDFFGPQFDEHRTELKELKDYVGLYGKRGPEFEPGSRWQYSNYGYLLLGLIVQRVSGQSYYDYVREHVFKIAGMNSTDSLPETTAVEGRSVGYTKDQAADELKPNTDTLPMRGTSAGGGYSTVGDLYRFAQALQANQLLSAKFTELLLSPKVNTVWPEFKYDYGFMETELNGTRWIGHGGSAPGMNGELWIAPEKGYVVVVLANLDPPTATQLARSLAPTLPE
jgi:D-alanyl-D-alanine carboxypeptidase